MYNLDSTIIPSLSGIYRIINTQNNKSYVGSAVNLRVRLHRHLYELRKLIHPNKYLQRAFNKAAVDNFKVEILEIFEYIEYKELLTIEKYYILKYNTLKKGYNLMLDTSAHFKNLNVSEKHIKDNIKRDSKSVYAIDIKTGEISYIFDSVSDCARFLNTSSSNISRVCKRKLNYIKGYTFCYQEEYSKEINYKKIHHCKDKPKSISHKAKLKKALQDKFGKKVFKYDLGMNLIEEYPSRAEAERCNNIKREGLRYKIDKETPFGGYYWKSK